MAYLLCLLFKLEIKPSVTIVLQWFDVKVDDVEVVMCDVGDVLIVHGVGSSFCI